MRYKEVKKLLLAPNSFKECANSVKIAEVLKSSLQKNSNLSIISIPISDGGDGFLQVCNNTYNLTDITYLIKRNYGDELIDGLVLYNEGIKTVYLESAELFGLKRVVEKNRNPMKLNTKSLGSILIELAGLVNSKKLKIDSVWIGVGGTATIDFGIGACSQLGLKLLDENSNPLDPYPSNFNKTQKLAFSPIKLPYKITCIVDVDTILVGEPGSIEIFGKQKGASENDLEKIKKGIVNILNLYQRDLGIEVLEKLNGAGGGLAAGLNILFNAEIISSSNFINDYLFCDLDINSIDAVITGEGRFDYQSYEGKGISVILNKFQNTRIPIFLINGSSSSTESNMLPDNIFVFNIEDFFHSKEDSIKNYEFGLQKAAQLVLNHLNK